MRGRLRARSPGFRRTSSSSAAAPSERTTPRSSWLIGQGGRSARYSILSATSSSHLHRQQLLSREATSAPVGLTLPSIRLSSRSAPLARMLLIPSIGSATVKETASSSSVGAQRDQTGGTSLNLSPRQND